MNIVFYSTNSNRFDPATVNMSAIPSYGDGWEALARRHPEHSICIATQPPGMFLLDGDGGRRMTEASAVRYVRLTGRGAEELADEIAALAPDLAVAATYWVPPIDWLGIQDARIAVRLRARGIRTCCHGVEAAATCFDKARTRALLQRVGLPVPRAVCIHHELFWCERSTAAVQDNVYKDYVLEQLERLAYPVVIKDTVGLSSYGMEVATTYREAAHYVRTARLNADRLVEEYVDGVQCGTEIYGSAGRYTVMEPLLFSVNRYGITSPRQSVKLGPPGAGAFPVREMRGQLVRLAAALDLCGVAQVDMVFRGGVWYVLDVNARLSGMTETYAALLGISVPELLLRVALGEAVALDAGASGAARTERRAVCNIKLPILDEERLQAVARLPFVRLVRQTHNLAARQEREKGYCEAVLCAESPAALVRRVEELEARFPGMVEPVFLRHVRGLAARCGA